MNRMLALASVLLLSPGATRCEVFVGSITPNYVLMADPAAMAGLLAAKNIGLYQHANGNATLTPAQRAALWRTWRPTGVTPSGQGHSVGEIGGIALGATPPSYLSYFGGGYPDEVNMNILTGSGDGTGTYTAGPGDAHPKTAYTGFTSLGDLAAMRSAIQEAQAHGAKNVAIVMSPNGGHEDYDDPFATAPYWAQVRAAALAGHGIALDVPPSYFYARPPFYQNMIVQMIKWSVPRHLRVSLIVSPHADARDARGCHADTAFLENTQRLVAQLSAANALPTQWVVELYGAPGPNCGTTNDISNGVTPESLNAVALYLAQTKAVQ